TFTGATALLALGNTTYDALVDSDALVESLKMQLAQAREDRDQAFLAASQFFANDLAGYVTTIAKGDASIILASGLDVAEPRGPSPSMTNVEGVVIFAGADEGTATIKWDTM